MFFEEVVLDDCEVSGDSDGQNEKPGSGGRESPEEDVDATHGLAVPPGREGTETVEDTRRVAHHVADGERTGVDVFGLLLRFLQVDHQSGETHKDADETDGERDGKEIVLVFVQHEKTLG